MITHPPLSFYPKIQLNYTLPFARAQVENSYVEQAECLEPELSFYFSATGEILEQREI